MAKERLSTLQKKILEIYQEKYRQLNIKWLFCLTRLQIARELSYKTGKIYWIPRYPLYASDREAACEIIKKTLYILAMEAKSTSEGISPKTTEEIIELRDNYLSSDAKELMRARRERMEYHKDYDKRQVSLTRSLKSLVEKKYLRAFKMDPQKTDYFITEKGLNVKLPDFIKLDKKDETL